MQKSIMFLIHFLQNFDGCWPHVGTQNPPKIDQTSNKKSLQKIINFLVEFILIYVGFWLQVGGSQGGPWRPISSPLGVLIGSWAQDGPQTPPRGLPRPIFEPNMAPRPPPRDPREQIFGWFFVNFGVFCKQFQTNSPNSTTSPDQLT